MFILKSENKKNYALFAEHQILNRIFMALS